MESDKMWKDDVIALIKLKTKDEARTIMQKACKKNCHVSNFNFHCPRCKLIKYFNTREN